MKFKGTGILAAVAAVLLTAGLSATTLAQRGGHGQNHPQPDPATNAGGKIAAISGNTISVARRDGATDVILVTDATTFMRNREAATLADFKAGDFAHAQGARNESNQLVATAVFGGDRPPRGPNPDNMVFGKVVAVDATAGTITLENPEGGTVIVHTDAETHISRNRQDATLADFQVNDRARARGERDDAGRFIADGIRGGNKAGGEGRGKNK